ncbi:MAG: PAS domain S-box protein [Desulfobulbaceae bacterium]|nr:PAS domain S-box protein [Desulfobulbaceae bacterium]
MTTESKNTTRDAEQAGAELEALRQSEAKFRAFFENGPEYCYMVSAEGIVLDVNRSALDILGYRRQELVGKPIKSIYVPEELPRVSRLFERWNQTGILKDEELVIRTKSGERRTILLSVSAVKNEAGDILHSISVQRDVTDRKKTEEKLQQTATRLREAQRIAHIGSWELDLINNTLTWSDEIYRIFEIDPEKFSPSYEAFLDTVHPEDRKAVDRAFTDSLKSRIPYSVDHRLLFPDGRIKHVHEQCETFYDAEGRPLRSVGTVQDITERKLAEDAERRLNRELRAISNCNQTLMRATDEQSLLNEICRIICDEAGYLLAWVGFAEQNEAKTIRLAAHAGFDRGYISQAKITWADTELGRGPSGIAIRSGKICCIQDFSTDPKAAPWRDNALARGYRSSIALPLKDDEDKTFGVLSIYSQEASAFTPDEIRILEELAGDLAFGINVLRARIEHKEAEEELAKAHQLLETIFNHTHIMVAYLDPDFNFIRVNRAYAQADQRNPAFFTGKNHFDLYPNVENEKVFRKVVESGEGYFTFGKPFKYTEYPERGVSFWDWSLTPLKDSGGKVTGLIFTLQDVTDRMLAEEERLTHLHFFESMDMVNRAIRGTSNLEQMMDDVLDVAVKIFDCDRAWLLYPCDPGAASWQIQVERSLLEYSGLLPLGTEFAMEPLTSELMRTVLNAGRPVRSDPQSDYPLAADDAERFGYKSRISMALRPKTGKPWMFVLHQCSYPRVWKQQDERLFQEIGRRLSDGLTSLLSYRDLRQNEEFLTNIIENIPDMIFVKDAETLRFVRCNQAGERLLGYSREEMKGKNDYDLFPEEEAQFFTDKDREALKRKILVDIPEEPIRNRDGQKRIIHTKKIPILDQAGNPRYLLGISEDITEQRKMKERLREKKMFIRNILETVDEGFIVVNREYRILLANRAFCRFVGLPEEQVVGRHCYEVYNHLDIPCFLAGSDCAAKRTFESGKPHTASHSHIVDSDKHYAEIRSYPYSEVSGRVETVIETITDLTETKKLEEQLRHAQKLEALGTLAGGIAHDFNNILSVIVGYSDMMEMNLSSDDPARPYLQEILAASKRAARLTQALLIFSRKQIAELMPIDLNEVVSGMKKMVFRIIGEDIQTVVELEPVPLIVMGDYGQLEQVLMNFATNARDAMPQGGTLTIETQFCNIDEKFIQHHGFGSPGEFALISVKDTGQGMEDQTREKIFEPFFTTKELGKGTGLGLSIIYGIIKQHHGYISCSSEPGKGTVFQVYLPIIRKEAPRPDVNELSHVQGGTETILIADDDEHIRKVTRTLLENRGYKILEAMDGQEAVNIYREHCDDIQLVLLDIVMPRKSGREAFEEMREIRPGLKVLFVSGYSENTLEMQKVMERGQPLLQKPVKPRELLARMRELLDKKES